MDPYRPLQPTRPGDVSPELYALVERQAKAWETGDFGLCAADWHPDGVLVSPGGSWPVGALEAEMAGFFRHFTDLRVTVKNVFAAADGRKLAVEWDWTVTRRNDGVRGTTPDAIIADLEEGKIRSWREYFDLSGSVEG